MWESPIYRFRIPKEGNEESLDLKELVIDVTGSAPPFKEPSEALKEVINQIFDSEEFTKINAVLEFGAAKLKNIPYLLKKGKSVCAVEFQELSENVFTKKMLKKCRTYGSKFQELIFPKPFSSDSKKFDLAMLLNVVPVMPIPAERFYLLNLLYEKINDGKYLLWVAQKEGPYKKIKEDGKNFCGDGIWMGKGRYRKTFYRYYPVDELDEVMALYGFELVKRFDVADDARLYKKTKYNIFKGIVSVDDVDKYISQDSNILEPENPDKLNVVKKGAKHKLIVPNPKELSIEQLYINKLISIPAGTDHAEEYHRVVSLALSRIFRKALKNMEMKLEVDGGVKIIDTVFTNCAKEGFFHDIKDKVECMYPVFELKNISDDPKNTDLDQLNGRLNSNHGHFGVLVCRKIENKDAVYSRCKTYLPDNIVISLTDNDIIEMLKLIREENKEEINDLMDKILRKIIF